MKLLFAMTTALTLLIAHVALAETLPAEAQRILDELGAPEVQEQNNGRKFRCLYGGYKTIHVGPLSDATLFSGDYNNCREDGSSRDGYYEVIVKDGEIVGQSSKRSINGELQDAARARDIKKVRSFIRKGADVNFAEQVFLTGGGKVNGWTPLMSSALLGDAAMVKLLLKAGAHVNYLNSRVVGPLWLAAGSGSLESVKLLLAGGAKVNNSDDEEVTPLMCAAMNGHAPIVRLLLKSGADINRVHKEGDSALMFALANRHTAAARVLIDSGADVNIRNKYGSTALLIAVAEKNEEIVLKLIEKNADVTIKLDNGKTLMDIAVAGGDAKIIELLKKAQVL